MNRDDPVAATKQLWELCTLIRSKNAGPFWLTIDLMFSDADVFEAVRRSRALNRATVGALYGVDESDVRYFEHPAALALKVSFPRPTPSGSSSDTDMYGGQFHAPLVDLQIPVAQHRPPQETPHPPKGHE